MTNVLPREEIPKFSSAEDVLSAHDARHRSGHGFYADEHDNIILFHRHAHATDNPGQSSWGTFGAGLYVGSSESSVGGFKPNRPKLLALKVSAAEYDANGIYIADNFSKLDRSVRRLTKLIIRERLPGVALSGYPYDDNETIQAHKDEWHTEAVAKLTNDAWLLTWPMPLGERLGSLIIGHSLPVSAQWGLVRSESVNIQVIAQIGTDN